jgi:hypothetical protein
MWYTDKLRVTEDDCLESLLHCTFGIHCRKDSSPGREITQFEIQLSLMTNVRFSLGMYFLNPFFSSTWLLKSYNLTTCRGTRTSMSSTLSGRHHTPPTLDVCICFFLFYYYQRTNFFYRIQGYSSVDSPLTYPLDAGTNANEGRGTRQGRWRLSFNDKNTGRGPRKGQPRYFLIFFPLLTTAKVCIWFLDFQNNTPVFNVFFVLFYLWHLWRTMFYYI